MSINLLISEFNKITGYNSYIQKSIIFIYILNDVKVIDILKYDTICNTYSIIPDHLTCLLRNLYQVKKQQIEPDMEQQTGSKLEKGYIKTVYCHPAYLTYMQSTSWEMPGWMKHKLESRLPGEISIISDMQMIPPLWQKAKRNWRASWWKQKRRVKQLA